MAFEVQQGVDLPYVASANVPALTWSGNPPLVTSGGIPQYAVVTYDLATGNQSDVIVASSSTVMPIGVAQSAGPQPGSAVTAPGQSLMVRTQGISKCIAGAAITVGQLLAVNASGQVVAAPAPAATNVFLIGQAESAATAAGDLVSVRLMLGATQQVSA